VEKPGGRFSSWLNHREDRKLGRDEDILEGIVWSEKPSLDHKKSFFVFKHVGKIQIDIKEFIGLMLEIKDMS
jgi:hypothetical protein